MATIQHCRDYEEMSRRAAARVIAAATAKRDFLLCAPTGHSPAGLYQELIREGARQPDLLRTLRVVKLDEWLGVPPADPVSCEHYLQSRLVGPVAIAAERYLSFDSETKDPSQECARISVELQRQGPIDVCILGLGRNGHVGLNEPAPNLQPHCHVAKLSAETLGHAMMSGRDAKPEFGLTLGMGDILASRKIVLLVTGKGKERAIEKFLEGTITTDLPASFLWLHQDVDVLLDDSCR
jgi:galactosamine-6-phosphate isomerase